MALSCCFIDNCGSCQRWFARIIGAAIVLTLVQSCARDAAEFQPAALQSKTLGTWVFATPEGNSLATQDILGRFTVVLFITTYDPASQIAATKLNTEIYKVRRRINALGVALEPPNHSVLVSVFRDSLHLSYPLLLPDPATLAGQGPFGAIDVVPTWVVLDPSGREIWRKVGANAAADLQRTLDDLGASAEP